MAVSNAIVQGGNVPIVDRSTVVETTTNCAPGRLVKKGTADTQIVVGTANCNPAGWLGYEQAAPPERPVSMTTAYAAGTVPPVLKGGGFVISAVLATSQTVAKDDALVAAADGMVQKAGVLELAAGSVDATSSAANGAIITGSAGVRVVGYAEESVTTTNATASIKVRSVI